MIGFSVRVLIRKQIYYFWRHSTRSSNNQFCPLVSGFLAQSIARSMGLEMTVYVARQNNSDIRPSLRDQRHYCRFNSG